MQQAISVEFAMPRRLNVTVLTDELHDAALEQLTSAGQLLEVHAIDRPWGEQLAFKNTPPNLGGFFMFMLQHAEKTFLVYREERYTFGEVWARANKIAAALHDHGVRKGDRVVIAMRNYPEWIFYFIGIVLIGGVAVPLNAWWKGGEIAGAIDDAGSKLAVVDAERHQRLSSVAAKIKQVVVRGSPIVDNAIADEDFVTGAATTPPPVQVTPDDDATIFYTSGSTSYPKGAVSTHRALTNAMFNFAAFGLAQQAVEKGVTGKEPSSRQPASLLSVPLFHVTGCHSIFMISVLIGRKVVILDKWDPEQALRLIEKERVTTFMGVPTMSRELTEHPNREDYDLSSLEEITAGGAARPAEQLKRLYDTHPNIRPGMAYGLTETNGTGAINNRDGYKVRPASTGRAPKPLAELAILDDAGERLPDGETGEIAVRAVTIARGYWNRPNDTTAAFTSEGWFKTGDLGILEADYLTIVDRKKDMILRGGENIACQEVEAAMLADASVLEACVFGVPDERLGEAVSAVVYVDPQGDFATDRHLEFLASRLAAFKLPKTIQTTSEPLPRLGSGKIDKLSIKRRFGRRSA
ncbi:MAG: class I adenylate-forming enzyme family protein [Pseudomonadota bacterium]